MFTLPELPYDYSALEPFIDEETMHIHHDKHHAGYVKNLNDLLNENQELLDMDVNELLKNFHKVPENIRQKVANNAGGVANHNMFWEIMCSPDKYKEPDESSPLLQKIYEDFGSWSGMQEYFNEEAKNKFGSGWVWIVLGNGKLDVVTTSNQDSPITQNLKPILCLDVWEHAYYLKYKNMRADYIKAWWNVVNWKKVSELFDKAGGENA